MNKYSVTYINWFDHELIAETIEAKTEFEAMQKHSKVEEIDFSLFNESDYNEDEKAEGLKTFFFDIDCMVNAHLIS